MRLLKDFRAFGGETPSRLIHSWRSSAVVAQCPIEWRTLEGYGAKSVAAYTPFEQLEGDAVDGAAIVEFPSMELAKAWYNSPAYRAIMHHRQQGARYIGLLMEGGLPPVELRMPHTKTRKPSEA
jgi:uncharacterized protein (DUF1330 family)